MWVVVVSGGKIEVVGGAAGEAAAQRGVVKE